MKCSQQPDFTLDEWAEQLLSPLDGERFPLSGSIELTERCNLSCVHCYINQPAADLHAKSQELNTDEWKELLDQMADTGCLFLLITGGEPLLREDFEEIFIHARKRGMLVNLFSNATMLTPKLVDLFDEWGLHSLEVSLYGATEKTYERVTGQPGSFERCIHGIKLALAKGINISLKTVLLTINRHELEKMRTLTEKLGMKFHYDSTLWPRLDGTMENIRYQIPNNEMLALDLEDPERLEAWLKTAESIKGQYLRAEKVFTCGAGYRSYHIDAHGRINPCMMVRNPSYDVLSMGFGSAWEKIGEIRSLKRKLNTKCETCPAGALCTQCPGWSLAYYGDYETPVPSVCELGQLRAMQISRVKV